MSHSLFDRGGKGSLKLVELEVSFSFALICFRDFLLDLAMTLEVEFPSRKRLIIFSGWYWSTIGQVTTLLTCL